MANEENYLDSLLQSVIEEEPEEKSLPTADDFIPQDAEETVVSEEEREPETASIDYDEIEGIFEDIKNLDNVKPNLNAVENVQDMEAKIADSDDDIDISDLLQDMNDEEDSADISELLERDENSETEEDMLSLLDGVEAAGEEADDIDIFAMEIPEDEIQAGLPEEDEEMDILSEEEEFADGVTEPAGERTKKKSSRGGKKEKAAGEEKTDKPKRRGFLAWLLALLTEEDDDLELEENGNEKVDISEENLAILDEMDQEKIKGGKKQKKEKDSKKEKKPKKDKKPKKEKAPKKEKKPKKEKGEKEPKAPGKKEKPIKKSKILCVIFFAVSVFALIYLITIYLPAFNEVKLASAAFAENNYDRVYELLADKKLDVEEEEMLKGANVVRSIQRKLDSYYNYMEIGNRMQAVNALFGGVGRYAAMQEDAEKYGVSEAFRAVYSEITGVLQNDYQISEQQAQAMVFEMDDLEYTKQLKAIVGGGSIDIPVSDEPVEERADLLPEEEELELEAE